MSLPSTSVIEGWRNDKRGGSLGRHSPVEFRLHQRPECQRWWTHAAS